ncbi:MAG: dCTP deaminase [Candidatus Chisholmbacteria bacterium]|nr:dCTP deaminase [Candidatus Chisholmbacteria bacterium]
MFLAQKEILGRVKNGSIRLKPFSKDQLGSAAYDLRLHQNFRVFVGAETHIDVKEPFDVTKLKRVKLGGAFVIHPGEFVLASTLEEVSLPGDLMGVLEGRSSLGRIGLIVHATAAFIGPGFAGHLTFEMSNISSLPIQLYAGMRVAQLAFATLSSTVPLSRGTAKSRYQDQAPPTPSKIWQDFEK